MLRAPHCLHSGLAALFVRGIPSEKALGFLKDRPFLPGGRVEKCGGQYHWGVIIFHQQLIFLPLECEAVKGVGT